MNKSYILYHPKLGKIQSFERNENYKIIEEFEEEVRNIGFKHWNEFLILLLLIINLWK